jgi:hypothetical protein
VLNRVGRCWEMPSRYKILLRLSSVKLRNSYSQRDVFEGLSFEFSVQTKRQISLLTKEISFHIADKSATLLDKWLHAHIVKTFCCCKIDFKDHLERDNRRHKLLCWKLSALWSKLEKYVHNAMWACNNFIQQCSSFIQNAEICVIYLRN